MEIVKETDTKVRVRCAECGLSDVKLKEPA